MGQVLGQVLSHSRRDILSLLIILLPLLILLLFTFLMFFLPISFIKSPHKKNNKKITFICSTQPSPISVSQVHMYIDRKGCKELKLQECMERKDIIGKPITGFAKGFSTNTVVFD